MPVIGFMSSRSPENSVAVVAAFRRGLGEGGLSEGKNVIIEFRWARGEYDKLPAIAAELLRRRIDVLVAAGGDPRHGRPRLRPRQYLLCSAAAIRSKPDWWRA